jgi:hypothetical protein
LRQRSSTSSTQRSLVAVIVCLHFSIVFSPSLLTWFYPLFGPSSDIFSVWCMNKLSPNIESLYNWRGQELFYMYVYMIIHKHVQVYTGFFFLMHCLSFFGTVWCTNACFALFLLRTALCTFGTQARDVRVTRSVPPPRAKMAECADCWRMDTLLAPAEPDSMVTVLTVIMYSCGLSKKQGRKNKCRISVLNNNLLTAFIIPTSPSFFF